MLLGAYRAAYASGALGTPWGRALFDHAYGGYKSVFEARGADLLRPYVRPGTTAIDVGANIGFFTTRFAEWVSPGGSVLAIEPEAANLARLGRALARRRVEDVVEVIAAVAAEEEGELRLARNPYHPGDHRIAARGEPVAAVTIDGLLGARGWPEVSLIKVDVQGAEARVLAGAEATLRRFRPALFIEIDDQALRAMGSGAVAVLAGLSARGYAPHLLGREGLSAAFIVPEAASIARRRGYADFLLLADSGPAARGE